MKKSTSLFVAVSLFTFLSVATLHAQSSSVKRQNIYKQIQNSSLATDPSLLNQKDIKKIQKLAKENESNNGDQDTENESKIEDVKTKAREADDDGLSSVETILNKDREVMMYSPLYYEPVTDNTRFDEHRRVKQSIVKQYGYSFFEQGDEFINKYLDVPVSDDYVLGSGDQLIIRIWGKIDEEVEVEINNRGDIYIPKIGQITLTGESLGNAKRIIKKELSKFYINFDVSVTVGKLRTIKVFVIGEVRSPGAYNISSLSDVMMALLVSGGPKKMGSLRDIKIIRNNKVVNVIDLYDYFLTGKFDIKFKLQANDSIFVPVLGNVVKVEGEVKRPGIFEFKNSLTLYQALNYYSGGFLPDYYSKRIQVERIVEGEKFIVVDVESQSDKGILTVAKKQKILDGDVIRVLPINDQKNNIVQIQGSVARPGVYAFEEGTTIGTLIEKADGLLPGAIKSQVDVYRQVGDIERQILSLDLDVDRSFELNEFDIVRVYSSQEISGERYVRISGSVITSGKYKLLDGMRVSDLIFIAGTLKNSDLLNGELIRKSEKGFDKIIPINIQDVIENPSSNNDIYLEPEDHIYIRENFEKQQLRVVQLRGNVIYPGEYIVRAGERLSDLLTRAGGLSENAFLKGIVLKRETIKELEAQSVEKLALEEHKRFMYEIEESQNNQQASGLNRYQDMQNTLTFLKENAALNSGRLVLNLSTLDALKQDSKNNVLIEDGDNIYIPEKPSSVQVLGGIQQSSAFIFEPNKTAGYYIDQSGGYSKYAMRDNVLIIKPSGRVSKSGKIDVGDTIYVPEEVIIKTDFLTFLVRISQIIANVATSIAVINAIN